MNRKLKNAVITTTSKPVAASPATLEFVLKIPAYGKRFGVTKQTVYKWLAMGLPHFKPSRKITRIPVAEADEWMKQQFLRQRERS